MTLSLTGITHRYGDQTVLDGVSLHLRAGDCYGFLGHNGAGKTTALRVALGLVRPDAGRVVVDGFDAALHPLEARARMGGLIETPGFHGHLSGRKNLVLLARLGGMSRQAAKSEADRLLGVVGLAAAAEKRAGAFSQGMRQRLGIAQALLGGPRYVLLDEPLNGLDPEGIEEMRRLLRRLTREEGTTVLLSSHQLADVAEICNRIGILRQGKMLLEEETATLLAGAQGRYVLTTAAGSTEIDLAGRSPAEVLRELVSHGADVRSFAPKAASLEEIYLAASRGETRGSARTDAPAEEAPSQPRAPRHPVLRTARYDLARWCASAAVPLALALPAAVAVGRIVHESSQAQGDPALVAAGRLASSTEVTAFKALGAGLAWGMPTLAVALVVLGAQSIAAESSRGTLRNVVLRPVGRARMTLGKALSAGAAGVAGFVLLAAASFAAAAAFFDFADLSEVLPNGARMPVLAAGEVWPEVSRALLQPLPALAVFAALGLLVGALVRSAAGAMAAAFLVAGGMIVGLALVPPAALPSASVPWWSVRDVSAVGRLFEVAQGFNDAPPPASTAALAVSALWTAGALSLACLVMHRRAVP